MLEKYSLRGAVTRERGGKRNPDEGGEPKGRKTVGRLRGRSSKKRTGSLSKTFSKREKIG